MSTCHKALIFNPRKDKVFAAALETQSCIHSKILSLHVFFVPGDMWYQITAGEGFAYLTERAEDAHHSRDGYEAQPEPRIRYSSHARALSTVLNLIIHQKP